MFRVGSKCFLRLGLAFIYVYGVAWGWFNVFGDLVSTVQDSFRVFISGWNRLSGWLAVLSLPSHLLSLLAHCRAGVLA